MWGPCSIAKLVYNYVQSLGFVVLMTIVTWGYKPTYNVWGPQIVSIFIKIFHDKPSSYYPHIELVLWREAMARFKPHSIFWARPSTE